MEVLAGAYIALRAHWLGLSSVEVFQKDTLGFTFAYAGYMS